MMDFEYIKTKGFHKTHNYKPFMIVIEANKLFGRISNVGNDHIKLSKILDNNSELMWFQDNRDIFKYAPRVDQYTKRGQEIFNQYLTEFDGKNYWRTRAGIHIATNKDAIVVLYKDIFRALEKAKPHTLKNYRHGNGIRLHTDFSNLSDVKVLLELLEKHNIYYIPYYCPTKFFNFTKVLPYTVPTYTEFFRGNRKSYVTVIIKGTSPEYLDSILKTYNTLTKTRIDKSGTVSFNISKNIKEVLDILTVGNFAFSITKNINEYELIGEKPESELLGMLNDI